MAYGGIETGAGSGGNIGSSGSSFMVRPYTNHGKIAVPLSVFKGRVVASFQGAQTYLVATDFGCFICSYHGMGRGWLGASESAGFLPGTQVWIAIDPFLPGNNGFILSGASYPIAPVPELVKQPLVFPQVAGFEFELQTTDDATTAVPKRYSAEMYAELKKLRYQNTGATDAVDGDWVIQNFFGGGVGVESFRSFLRGGPMSGLFCFSEDNHTRIVGSRFERITMAEEYEDRPMGPTLVAIGRRVYYPMDAVFENVPQVLEIEGPQYAGKQEYRTYRDKDNLASLDGDQQENVDPNTWNRIALLHEYKGNDGTYILSSAGSITLQKTAVIRVPIEILEPETESENPNKFCLFDTPNSELQPRPLDSGTSQQQAVQNQEYTQPNPAINPLLSAMQIKGMLRRILERQIRSGFKELPKQWTKKDQDPKFIWPEGDFTDGKPNIDAGMWQALPKMFCVTLGPYGQQKRFYLGNAIISITNEGGIVLQDASGSRILMEGGNIVLQAKHDVIVNPGRNAVTMSGRDVVVKADRHLDLNANLGRLTVVAADQLTLVGGLDGFGGVLLQSKGEYASRYDQPDMEVTSGALILRAKHMLDAQAMNIMITGSAPTGWSPNVFGGGRVAITADEETVFQSRTYGGLYSIGNGIWGRYSAGGPAGLAGDKYFHIGESCYFDTLTVNKMLFYRNWRHVRCDGINNDTGGHYKIKEVLDKLEEFLETWTFSQPTYFNVPEPTPKWLSSKQYNIESETDFTLPEPAWQAELVHNRPATSVLRTSTVSSNALNSTTPMPGKSAMDDYGLAMVTDNSYMEEPSIEFTASYVGIDGNLLKGI